MATSKTGLSYFAETPSELSALEELKASQKFLTDAYQQRNQMFDPVLLAMAQGFLSPTKTGSFGEAIANTASLVGPAQQSEAKREQDMARMRYELAQQGLSQAQATSGEAEWRSMLNRMAPQAPTAPTGAAAPTAGAAPLAGGAPVEGLSPSGAPAAPQGMPSISQADLLRLRTRPGFEERGKAVQDIIEFGRKRLISTPQGMFDVDKGEYLPIEIPGQKQEEFSTPYGKFSMRPSDYEQFMKAERQGRGREWMKEYTTPKGAGPEGAPVEGGRKTVTESKMSEKEMELTMEQRIKDDAKRYEDFVKRGSSAGPQLARLTSLQQLVSRPDAQKYLGVFEGPELSNAMLKLFESSGKGLPQINEIRDMFTNLGLDKNVKADQLLAMQQIALVNLEIRKISRAPGEGAQSDLENKLALAAGLDRSDSPTALPKKIEFLKTQAQFERDLARELDRSKMNATKFVLSPEYERLLNNYEQRLSRVLGVSPQQVRPRTTPSAGSYGPASSKLREKLGIKP